MDIKQILLFLLIKNPLSNLVNHISRIGAIKNDDTNHLHEYLTLNLSDNQRMSLSEEQKQIFFELLESTNNFSHDHLETKITETYSKGEFCIDTGKKLKRQVLFVDGSVCDPVVMGLSVNFSMMECFRVEIFEYFKNKNKSENLEVLYANPYNRDSNDSLGIKQQLNNINYDKIKYIVFLVRSKSDFHSFNVVISVDNILSKKADIIINDTGIVFSDENEYQNILKDIKEALKDNITIGQTIYQGIVTPRQFTPFANTCTSHTLLSLNQIINDPKEFVNMTMTNIIPQSDLDNLYKFFEELSKKNLDQYNNIKQFKSGKNEGIETLNNELSRLSSKLRYNDGKIFSYLDQEEYTEKYSEIIPYKILPEYINKIRSGEDYQDLANKFEEDVKNYHGLVHENHFCFGIFNILDRDGFGKEIHDLYNKFYEYLDQKNNDDEVTIKSSDNVFKKYSIMQLKQELGLEKEEKFVDIFNLGREIDKNPDVFNEQDKKNSKDFHSKKPESTIEPTKSRVFRLHTDQHEL